ncbi:MAG: ABC transporter ATP-binding protein [Gammaproteobacteria bacterium]|nr:ABC transporter ATP-binding protein [Gammaproteobacteria bacterium]
MTISLPLLAPAISLSHAYLRFKQKIIFENLAIALPSGKFTCLLGPSGVGKTSLLRMIAGLPLAGRGTSKLQNFPNRKPNRPLYIPGIEHDELNLVYQAELETSDSVSLTGRVAYMAQSDLLLPWCSLLDNVLLGSDLRGERNQSFEINAIKMLESVGLGAEIHVKPHALSSGMRQRGALARTLMEDQPVVLMDEPFSALDAITRYDMQALAAEKLHGKTVLLITHDPWEALRLAHQIFILRGDPAQLSLPIFPPDESPRDLTNPALLALQKQLIAELHSQEALR